MIYEHEIPNGSHLYFGPLAKLKREIEYKASDYLQSVGFEEISTPSFSYSQHQSIDDSKKLITLNDQQNNTLALRADSTLDVVRIITKRLGRATEHKKWFYNQPVFTYPSNETNQIGLEWIEHEKISDIINLNCKLFDILNLEPLIQIANINIPLIISKNWDIDIVLFKNGEIGELSSLNLPWLDNLIKVETSKDLEKTLSVLPDVLKSECQKLIDIANEIEYKNVAISPIFYSAMRYYDDIYYKAIYENHTVAKGGGYSSNGINSLGFALYTDNILKIKQKGRDE